MSSDGVESPLSSTVRSRRAYRTVTGRAATGDQITASALESGRFDRGDDTDEDEGAARTGSGSLDAAFRAAEASYGEHGGGSASSMSASWPGRPAVAWSQSAGSPFAVADEDGSVSSDADDPVWDPHLASPKGFPPTPEIGAFSALASRRLYGLTPPPIVTQPMAFRPDVAPMPRATTLPLPVAPPPPPMAGLVEYPAPPEPPVRLHSVPESTRIFILSGTEEATLAASPVAPPPSSETATEAQAVTDEATPAAVEPEESPSAPTPSVEQHEVVEDPPASPVAVAPAEPVAEAPPALVATGTLAASVLTSPARFLGAVPEVALPAPSKQWGFKTLVFGVSMAITVTAGVLSLGQLRPSAPALQSATPEAAPSPPAAPALALRGASAQPEASAPAPGPIPTSPPIEIAEAAPVPAAAPEVTQPSPSAPPEPPSVAALEPPPPAAPAYALLGAAPPALPPAEAGPAPAKEESRARAVEPRHRTIVRRPAPETTRAATLRPQPPAHRRQSRTAELDVLTKEAEALLSTGKIAEARAAFRRAAAAGDPRGARGVARTYDEEIIARQASAGMPPDREKSKLWYQIANALESRRGSAPAPLPEDLR